MGTPESMQFFDQIHKALLFWEQGYMEYKSQAGDRIQNLSGTVPGRLLSGLHYLRQTTMRHPQKRKDMAVHVI